jgi:hypothetical protein
VGPAGEPHPTQPATRSGGSRWASARTGRAFVRSADASLLCLSGAKTRFCLLVGAFELAQARQAGGALPVDLGLVELIALAGVLSLGSQIVQMPGGLGFSVEGRGWHSCRGAEGSAAGESASALADHVEVVVAFADLVHVDLEHVRGLDDDVTARPSDVTLGACSGPV